MDRLWQGMKDDGLWQDMKVDDGLWPGIKVDGLCERLQRMSDVAQIIAWFDVHWCSCVCTVLHEFAVSRNSGVVNVNHRDTLPAMTANAHSASN